MNIHPIMDIPFLLAWFGNRTRICRLEGGNNNHYTNHAYVPAFCVEASETTFWVLQDSNLRAFQQLSLRQSPWPLGQIPLFCLLFKMKQTKHRSKLPYLLYMSIIYLSCFIITIFIN
jgi:hypothetical protein